LRGSREQAGRAFRGVGGENNAGKEGVVLVKNQVERLFRAQMGCCGEKDIEKRESMGKSKGISETAILDDVMRENVNTADCKKIQHGQASLLA